MKIALLARNPHLYSHQRICEAALSLGLQMPDEDSHSNQVRERDEYPEQSRPLEDFDFVVAIRNEREHDELCEPGATAAVQDPRLVGDRGVLEQPEFVPIARCVVARGDAKRGEKRHGEP